MTDRVDYDEAVRAAFKVLLENVGPIGIRMTPADARRAAVTLIEIIDKMEAKDG